MTDKHNKKNLKKKNINNQQKNRDKETAKRRKPETRIQEKNPTGQGQSGNK